MASTTQANGFSMEQPVTQRISQPRRILAVLFVVSFAMDFKGAAGGSPIQLLMAGLNSAAFLLLAVSYRMALPGEGFSAFVFWVWGAFLVTGTLGALVNSTPFAHYIRIVYTRCPPGKCEARGG